MLIGLSIRDVVIIETLDLALSEGLSALTGETGAGKSIILDALGMATGARSDKGLIRSGSQKAQVTASFDLPADHPVREILSEADVEFAPGESLLLRRTVGADGRSRAYINDQPVSVGLLSSVGSGLVEVHGQHDGRGLLDARTHIGLLDRYAGHKNLIAQCEGAYESLKAAKERVETLTASQAQADADRDFFEAAIAELDRLDPREGEEDELAERRRFLQSANSALTELNAAQAALGEEGEYEDRLAAALRGLEHVVGKIGEGESQVHLNLKRAVEALEKALIETGEARSAVDEACADFDVDPSELEKVEERFFALRAAARKYNAPIAELMALRQRYAQDLYDIDNADEAIKQAKKQLIQAKTAYSDAASALTRSRKAAARKLDKTVAAELTPLKLGGAKFETAIEPGREGRLGQDRVNFQVATNPGAPMGPLDKVASGGEMSRLALAIKVALAGEGDMTLIFDEVDQGVGGAVADAVGKRLALLAKTAQVLVVTHSPQVAACASEQMLISKSVVGDKTHTQVRRLSEHEREEEIARMLAGSQVTDAARGAARQLMDNS